jgi:hypothetical protein
MRLTTKFSAFITLLTGLTIFVTAWLFPELLQRHSGQAG